MRAVVEIIGLNSCAERSRQKSLCTYSGRERKKRYFDQCSGFSHSLHARAWLPRGTAAFLMDTRRGWVLRCAGWANRARAQRVPTRHSGLYGDEEQGRDRPRKARIAAENPCVTGISSPDNRLFRQDGADGTKLSAGKTDKVPTKSKTPPAITAEQSVSEAFATILRHNFDYTLTWLDEARSWTNTEGVHQTRVAVRRMRSALTLFRDAVPKEASDPWGTEMRWIAGQLGRARDLDVFITEGLATVGAVLPLAGKTGLRRLVQEQRERAYENEVRQMLSSARMQRFIDDFPKWVEARAWEQFPGKKKQAKRLASNVLDYCRRLLDKQERRVLAAGTHVDRDNHVEMHQLRIECKKLRYAAEFFQTIVSGMDGFIHHMKGLQDLLGVMNDVAVTQRLLEDLFADNGDKDVSIYAGAVLGWRACEYQQLLARFDDYWDEFVSAKHPWWKKGSIGN